MKVRDVIKRLEQDGWRLARTKGSHRQFHHPAKPGTVTAAGHPSVDIPPRDVEQYPLSRQGSNEISDHLRKIKHGMGRIRPGLAWPWRCGQNAGRSKGSHPRRS